MAVEKSSLSELIEIDRNYLSRITWRRRIIRDHPATVVGADRSGACNPAIEEFYVWLLGTYLPTRFPRMFELVVAHSPPSPDEKSGGTTTTTTTKTLRSLVTDETFPVVPAPADPVEALKAIGGLVDDDVQLLLPETDGDGYAMRGFVTCCPSGFNMSEKLGLKLRDIHAGVPGYGRKLERSMDRFFDRLEVGTVWAMNLTDNPFTPSGTKLREGDEKPEGVEVDISQVHLRSERQMVHRLPKTGAIVFFFKTYLYPIADIKAEGLGEELATAIDGLKLGSVPEFHWYKRAPVWGEVVKKYLRS
ncbi:putative conserved hypothetical protein [Diplodia seriata]|uniref:HRQ family protein 2 n=1 Tax=Diplodia seriata TaxID=420778 RepID=A0A0G2E0K2_9PEZI|nr:putative conserved hypothetical protein [Diplodia seriata]